MQWPSGAQELGGRQCQGIGAKIGRAIHISTDKASLLLSQPAMDTVWFHTMSPHRAGPLVRHILEGSFATNQSKRYPSLDLY